MEFIVLGKSCAEFLSCMALQCRADSPMLTKLAHRQHIVTAAVFGRFEDPVFNFNSLQTSGPLRDLRFQIHLNSMPVILSQLRRKFFQILEDIEELISLVGQDTSGGPAGTTYSSALQSLQGRLSTPWFHDCADGCYPIYECCRIATLLLVNAASNRVPLRAIDQTQSTALIATVQASGTDHGWHGSLDLIYIISMIGSGATLGKPQYNFFNVAVNQIILKMAVMESEYEVGVICGNRFTRLQRGLDRNSLTIEF